MRPAIVVDFDGDGSAGVQAETVRGELFCEIGFDTDGVDTCMVVIGVPFVLEGVELDGKDAGCVAVGGGGVDAHERSLAVGGRSRVVGGEGEHDAVGMVGVVFGDVGDEDGEGGGEGCRPHSYRVSV
eukprot:TRINITY_DN3023_c0_g3_i1.p3 TRINITY_DN3023_c0_g3~~TRINITY_DN3023_c0_g3_i1.p3  ORF type:complete len:127 (+),score=5.88 TRINITY_DN3023_c0_g3_i1:966-1346(+)